jgi:hypothetical protein
MWLIWQGRKPDCATLFAIDYHFVLPDAAVDKLARGGRADRFQLHDLFCSTGMAGSP